MDSTEFDPASALLLDADLPPIVVELIVAGWSKGQILYESESRAPKHASQDSQGEMGKILEEPSQLVTVFASDEAVGDWDQALGVIEVHDARRDVDANNLEELLGLVPRARFAYWSNGTDTLLLSRRADGSIDTERGAPLPVPHGTLSRPAGRPVTSADLVQLDAGTMKSTLERVFAGAGAEDTRSLHKDDRLNQVCNLVLVKLDSDRQAIQHPSEPVGFQAREREEDTAASVRRSYESMRSANPGVFNSTADLELEFDDHSIHEVAYELGPVRLFDAGAAAAATALEVLSSTRPEAPDGSSSTPAAVVRSAVRLLEITRSDSVIDPACGTGAFLVEAYRAALESAPGAETDVRSWGATHLCGVDIDAVNVKLARASLEVHGVGGPRVLVGDAIREANWASAFPHLVEPLGQGSYTVVVTNPPLAQSAKLTKRDAKAAGLTISSAAAGSPREFKDVELGIAYLERAWRLLSPGGRLGIVLPEAYFSTPPYAWLQKWVQARLVLRGMFNLAMEAFHDSPRVKTNFYVFEKSGSARG